MPSILDDPRLRDYVLQNAGEEGLKVVELLEGRKESTDTELAASLGSKPSHVRKVLYDLFEARVAEYTKEKDKESGWLTFIWHVTPENAVHAIEQRRRKDIDALRTRIQAEQGHEWYVCPQDGARFDFAGATELSFHCSSCGALLQHDENAKRLQDMERQLRQLEGGQA